MAVAAGFRNWLARTIAGKSMTVNEFAERFARAADETDGDESGVSVSRPFEQSVWVYSAINLIARSLARVPFVITDKQTKEMVKSGPVVDLYNRPNPKTCAFDFVVSTIVRLLTDGHTFWERRGLEGNRPKEIWVQPLAKLRPDIRRDCYGDDFAFRWIRNATGEPLLPYDEIYEWKLDNPYDDVYGLAPLSPAALSIYCDVATGVYNKKFFKNGARPGLVFSTDDPRFDAKAADDAYHRWNSRHRGAANAHKAAFMGHKLTPHEIGYTLADMQFDELKRMSKSEILAIFGVPDTMMGTQPKSAGVEIGGSGRKPDEENFYLNTVMCWGEQFAWMFDHVVAAPFGEYESFFDFRQVPILQDRMLERAKEGREYIKAGATFNDVVKVFGLDLAPQPTGDEWWVPSNMLPARLLMNGPIAADPGESQKDPADKKDAKKAFRMVEAA